MQAEKIIKKDGGRDASSRSDASPPENTSGDRGTPANCQSGGGGVAVKDDTGKDTGADGNPDDSDSPSKTEISDPFDHLSFSTHKQLDCVVELKQRAPCNVMPETALHCTWLLYDCKC